MSAKAVRKRAWQAVKTCPEPSLLAAAALMAAQALLQWCLGTIPLAGRLLSGMVLAPMQAGVMLFFHGLMAGDAPSLPLLWQLYARPALARRLALTALILALPSWLWELLEGAVTPLGIYAILSPVLLLTSLWLSMRLCFAAVALAQGRAEKVGEALRFSWRTTRGRVWRIVGNVLPIVLLPLLIVVLVLLLGGLPQPGGEYSGLMYLILLPSLPWGLAAHMGLYQELA